MQVTRTGQTYRVVWVVGNARYVGTGIGNREGLAVSYKSGNSSGLALYGADGGNGQGDGPIPAAVTSAPKSGNGASQERDRAFPWILTATAL